MIRKPTSSELFGFIVAALLICIVVGYVLVCIFLMVIGIVAEDLHYFGYGLGMAACPLVVPTVIGDIKEWFF